MMYNTAGLLSFWILSIIWHSKGQNNSGTESIAFPVNVTKATLANRQTTSHTAP
jgi:hypothetical protein